ncbi:MAG: phosphotransferase [Hyphomicrobiaceae bacterium]|nr:phosphotransferase [Hyphomicrobiaceae bacterium]
MRTDPAFAGGRRFFKGNLHTHSDRSDGALSPAAVCAAYRERGYDFLALTDHFQAKYGFPVVDTRPFRSNRFTTLLGAEVHAPQTCLGHTWHILAVGLPQDFAPTAHDETGPALAERCAAAGAYVAIAHPAWYGLTVEDAESIACAHAIEIYNHTSQVRTSRGDGTAHADQLHARGRRLGLCAVDDAHFHCADAFGGFVMVAADANEPEALIESLKAGRYYASQGPVIEHVAYAHDSVEIACSPAHAVMVLGRGSRATQRLGDGLTRVVLPLEAIAPGGYARVVVADAEGRRAWTNPVWF